MVKTTKVEKTEKGIIPLSGELANFFNKYAMLGTENLVGKAPILKVHSQGRSTTNFLEDGSEPQDGSFFYTPMKEDFGRSITVHILTISRGFRTDGVGGKKDVFNQLVGGIIKTPVRILPFLMFFSGKRLKYLWEFGKEISQYTRQKPVPIPMFAIEVRMFTEKVRNDYGASWVVNFEIQKEENGIPVFIKDVEFLNKLKDKVEEMKIFIEDIIEAKSTEEEVETTPIPEPIPISDIETSFEKVSEEELEENEEKISVKDIPF